MALIRGRLRRPRGWALGTAAEIYTRRGVLVARARRSRAGWALDDWRRDTWTRLRHIVTAQRYIGAEQRDALRQALERIKAKYSGIRGDAIIRERDVLTQLLSGTLFALQLPDGRIVWPIAVRQHASDWLDWLYPRHGSMLVRTVHGWRPTVNCTPGAVMTLTPDFGLVGCCAPASYATGADFVGGY